MAIRPDTELAPNITAASPEFPLGSAKNESAPGVNDGTPYNLTRADDIFGAQQALLKAANIVASGDADTALDKNSSQYLQALLHQVLSGFVFTDSGIADAYVLDVVDNNPSPADYEDNMTFVFTAGNTNTGASTVNVESLGIKNIFLKGAALTGGEIVATERITIVFDVANDRFNLVAVGILTSLTLTGSAASPPDSNTLVKDNIIKALINFSGTGIIAIRGSYNVSGIVDNGVGDYTVTWNRNFANADYATTISAGGTAGTTASKLDNALGDYTAGSIHIAVLDVTHSPIDVNLVCAIAVGDQ